MDRQLNKGKLLKVLAIGLPIVVIAAWIVSYAVTVRTGVTIRLAVSGYDPRDLLSGHYLRYVVEYGGAVDCPVATASAEKCVCLDGKEHQFAKISDQGDCRDNLDCKNLLKGTCNKGRFEAGIERFYFPEEYVKQLRIVPPDASIVVALSPAGKGVVKELLVMDESILEWVKKKMENQH